MYEHILFPTDGSSGAEAALAHARTLAETHNATLHIMTVLDTSSPHIGMTAAGPEGATTGMTAEEHDESESGMVNEEHNIESSLRERSQAIVDAAADEVDGVDTVTAVEHGPPHSAILDYVDENDIDLIVMGTHGRTGVERYLLGSVAEKVVRTSDVPVLTARLGEDDS
ncbi:universal stress protein [Haloarcula hispanica]|uniref:Universal stress protein n=1 Tax=Haloarcula hispanica TaxID=51589 RepID=A0A482T4U7_HALHI|nr:MULTISPECIES: universal stress protein [Haloarcula]AJF26931.1 universal stress protein [Haloarcula sp. CBA1115]KAA9407269.1 universal stress protein [Haloarcula sp. CBA1131]MCJ0618731.1 universal stress protein [Haloarcula hispanica]RYJ09292.1 universal stress protein [Haloarcula hispanica]